MKGVRGVKNTQKLTTWFMDDPKSKTQKFFILKVTNLRIFFSLKVQCSPMNWKMTTYCSRCVCDEVDNSSRYKSSRILLAWSGARINDPSFLVGPLCYVTAARRPPTIPQLLRNEITSIVLYMYLEKAR